MWTVDYMMRTLLLRAIQAAVHAGYRILQIYNTDFQVWRQYAQSPVDTANSHADQIIRKFLHSTQIPILSQKSKEVPYQVRSTWEAFWLVDSLDGSREFVAKTGEFTVNIALILNHEPVLGVIFAPYMNLLYFADENSVAYKLERNFQMAGLIDSDMFEVFTCEIKSLFSQCKKLPLPQPVHRPYTIVGSRSHNTEELEQYLLEKEATIKNLEFVSIGSSLKFCVVAEGSADEYPRTGPTMEWDTAAGHAIARCAGAQVVQSGTGLPLLYNKASLKNPNFIVRRARPKETEKLLSYHDSCEF